MIIFRFEIKIYAFTNSRTCSFFYVKLTNLSSISFFINIYWLNVRFLNAIIYRDIVNILLRFCALKHQHFKNISHTLPLQFYRHFIDISCLLSGFKYLIYRDIVNILLRFCALKHQHFKNISHTFPLQFFEGFCGQFIDISCILLTHFLQR